MVHNRARTESIHFDSRIFDSPKWIKNHKKILIPEVNQKIFFDSRGRIIVFYSDSFWFILISDSN